MHLVIMALRSFKTNNPSLPSLFIPFTYRGNWIVGPVQYSPFWIWLTASAASVFFSIPCISGKLSVRFRGQIRLWLKGFWQESIIGGAGTSCYRLAGPGLDNLAPPVSSSPPTLGFNLWMIVAWTYHFITGCKISF